MATHLEERSRRSLATEVRFGVLGPVTVTEGSTALNIGGPKQRTVLAMLIVHAGNPVSTDSIANAVWGAEAAPNARRIVQTYVATLRAEVGNAIVKAGNGWMLDTDRDHIDALAFEDLYQSAREVADSNPQRASMALREGLAMWRGHPYAEVEAHGELDGETSRLSELRVAAQAVRVDADLALGRDADLVGEIEALIAEHPYSERFRAQHMLSLYRAGRQQEALRSYERMRTLLLEELGVDPTPELQDLEQRILEQDDSLRLVPAQTVQRRAVLVADPGDPIEIGHLPAHQREELLARTTRAVQSALTHEDGVSITAGATTYIVFDSPQSAASVAEAVTRRLDRTAMRMAIDWGDLVLENGRVSGPPVSRAAVMAAVAHEGQVLLSADAQQAIGSSGNGRGLRFENLGSYELYGVEGNVLIYQLLVGDIPPVFPDLETQRLPPPLPGGGDRSVPGYELREALGPGSLGTLYRAFQPTMGREVLVEVIGRSDSSGAEFVRDFEADAQRLSLLDHQNIAAVVDYWRRPDGAFLVYRYPRGGFLSQGAASIDPKRVVEQIGSALIYAHSLGMVHGSLRPDRVALDEAGNASLIGFPVANVKPLYIDQYRSYSAPELAAGENPSVASDVFALGVLARELIGADHPAVERATTPEPGSRLSSISEFLVELNPIEVDSPASRYTQTRNPYKGLAAFHERDAADFFGRASAVAELVEALHGSNLLTIVGPSGVGKSSVARAGLLPSLRKGVIPDSERWIMTDMLPGSHPFLELQRAVERIAVELSVELTEGLARQDPSALASVSRLLPEGCQLLILVDQFEELFTMAGENERGAFLDLVRTAADCGDARFVLTLRADFLDKPLRYSDFGDLVKRSTVMLAAPDPAELAEAIAMPARGVGVEIAPELVERMVAEVHDQPGALPLMQHTLGELFASRQSDLIGLESYEELGGVTGSLAKRAESIYGGLSEADQSRIKQVLLRLVTIVDEIAPTRRRVRLTDLADLDATDTVDSFARNRLLVFDNDPDTRTPTGEVAHEALLTHWPRLAAWIDATREDLTLSRRLDEAIRDWEDNERDSGYLLTGGRLAQHQAWTSSTSLVLTQRERDYLDASRTHDDRLRARSRRRRGLVMGGFAAAAAVSILFAFSASRSAAQAQGEALAAAAVAEVDSDPQLSLLLAMEAYLRHPSEAAISNMHASLQAHRQIMVIPPPDGSRGAGAALSPAGDRVAIFGFESSIVEMWDVEGSEPLWSVELSEDETAGIAPFGHIWFSESGEKLYLPLNWIGDGPSGPDVGIHILDSQTGDLVDFFPFPCMGRGMPAGNLFVDERELFVVDGADPSAVGGCSPSTGSAYVVNLSSEEILFRSPLVTGLIPEPTLSDDGQYLAFAGLYFDPATGEYSNDSTRVFDTESGEQVFAVAGSSAANLSSDGSRIAVGSNPMYMYDVESGARLQAFQSGEGTLFFTPDQTMLVGPGLDGKVYLYDADTGREELSLRGHTAQIRNAVFDADQELMVSSGFDAAIVWDASSLIRTELPPIQLPFEDSSPFYPDAITVSGDYVLVQGGPSPVPKPFDLLEPYPHRVEVVSRSSNQSLWNGVYFAAEMSNDYVVAQPVLEDEVTAPSGAFPATRLGPPVLLDVATGAHIRGLEGCGAYYSMITSFIPEPGEDCGDDFGLARDYMAFEFSADGDFVVGSTWLGATTVWEVETGEIVDRVEAWLTEPNPRFINGVRWAAALSSDGSYLVTPPGDELWRAAQEKALTNVVELATGDVVGTIPVDRKVNFSLFGPQDRQLVLTTSDVMIVDTDTWSIDVLTKTQGARIIAIAMSPNGELVATTSLDDTISVWDIIDRRLVAEIPVLGNGGNGLPGVAFLDSETIVVTTARGTELLTFTLNPEVLFDLAADSLLRGFRPEECATHNIDPCPTLDEIRTDR